MIFFPGGGFVERHPGRHALCETLALASGCIVVCVDYRLAPEHPFPAAPEDCYGALLWLHAHAAQCEADPQSLIVCGDSAGATLAAVTCLMSRERGGPTLAGQILAYPFLGDAIETASRRDLGFSDELRAAWHSYAPRPEDQAHPYATPVNAPDLRGLPPALILTAERDPLRDEGEEFAARLRASGNEITCVRIGEASHGFLTSPKVPHLRHEALSILSETVRAMLGRHPRPQ
jgi:acetyl esterase